MAPLDHVHEFLAGMTQQLAEFLHGLGTHATDQRDHDLAAQLRAQIAIIVVLGLYGQAVGALAHASSRHALGLRGERRRIQKVRQAHAELVAQVHQLVVGQREMALLHLGQRRQRDSDALTHLGKRPAVAVADVPDDISEAGLGLYHTMQIIASALLRCSLPRVLEDHT